MSYKAALISMLIVVCLNPCLTLQAQPAPSDLTLWYDKPAGEWVEALPVGNGRLGAMVFGGVTRGRYQLNEDSLWAGAPHDYARAGAHKVLPELRRLLFAGKQDEAHQLAMDEFMSIPLRQVAYQPLGDLELSFGKHTDFADYQRRLDLKTAVATTTYKVQGVTYTREVFVSHPDQVIIIRLACDRPGALTFTARLTSPQRDIQTKAVDAKTLALSGRVKDFKLRSQADPIVSKMTFEAGKGYRLNGDLELARTRKVSGQSSPARFLIGSDDTQANQMEGHRHEENEEHRPPGGPSRIQWPRRGAVGIDHGGADPYWWFCFLHGPGRKGGHRLRYERR